MFCKHCGKQIDENLAFCPYCGKAVKAVNDESVTSAKQYDADNRNNNSASNPQTVLPEKQASVNEVAEVPQTTVPENNMGGNSLGVNLNYQEPPKKKRKLPVVLAIVGVCVVAIAIIVALNFSLILGTCIKTFGSPSDYMRFVEAKEISSLATDFSKAYGENVLEQLSSDDCPKANLSVKLSDKGNELLTTLVGSGEDINLDWLKEVNLSVATNNDGDSQQVKMGLGLGGKNVISTDCIVDTKNKEAYIAIPELSKKYLKLELEDMGDINFDNIESIKKALPDEEELNDLIEKYADIVINALDNVDLDDSTLDVNKVEQDCTELTLTISERQVLEICRELLKEAENDKELMELINDLVDTVVSLTGETDVDVNDSIDELKEQIEDELDSLDGDGDEVFTLVDYVNGHHEIIGRAIEVEGEEVVSYGMVKDGSDISYQIKIGEEFVVTGEAEESGDKLDGEFVTKSNDEELLIIQTKDFDVEEFEGTLTLKPGASLADVSDSSMPISVSDVALQLNFLKEGADIKLLLQGEDLLTVSANSESEDSKDISIPDDVCDATDETAMSEYFLSVDINSIIDNLKDAGIPEELIEELQSSLLESAMSSY